VDTAQRQALVNSIAKHEGFRPHVYADTVGKLTIGYGRNLEDNGISKKEAAFLLQNDLDECIEDCRLAFRPWFDGLSPARQNVLIEMRYNLGLRRLLGFGQMIKALREGRYDAAADQALRSRWAEQVGLRAQTLAGALR
jgi:lysozyme